MRVQDVMTKDVVSVRPEMSVREVAAVMADKRISGVPVTMSDGRLVGVVSQSDLLHRAELGTERRRKWWLGILADDRRLAKEFSQAHGQTARDVMARHVVTIDGDMDLAEAAELLDSHRIKRLPVVRDGQLVGMLTRTDHVRAFASTRQGALPSALDDAAIHKALYDRMRSERWLRDSLVSATVIDGVVMLTGFVEGVEQKTALKVLAEEIAGVGRVEENVTVGLPMMMGV